MVSKCREWVRRARLDSSIDWVFEIGRAENKKRGKAARQWAYGRRTRMAPKKINSISSFRGVRTNSTTKSYRSRTVLLASNIYRSHNLLQSYLMGVLRSVLTTLPPGETINAPNIPRRYTKPHPTIKYVADANRTGVKAVVQLKGVVAACSCFAGSLYDTDQRNWRWYFGMLQEHAHVFRYFEVVPLALLYCRVQDRVYS